VALVRDLRDHRVPAGAEELAGTYASLPLGGVDAAVIAVAEQLNVATVATLNRRD
jgi:hypothetical protein